VITCRSDGGLGHAIAAIALDRTESSLVNPAKTLEYLLAGHGQKYPYLPPGFSVIPHE
jgi:hypothetical protein